ncbi:hypothetical protein IFM89_032506 [Coptis chinensis]|uniref:tRNA (guanine-N(7)-)-methyltransferase non-catalytic subunit n=1 Tax=Coptis chinensis TaxID=261450 RepID=A0A835IUP0_9MAGN|nr:hypothetical protein IFM89_032506 [Coptis chinensis]
MEESMMMEEGEVAPALIAIHPVEKSVVVAIGSELRVFDLQEDCASSLVDDSGRPLHMDSIRAISFGADGRLFVSAGDDKLVKIWTTNPWHCIRTVLSEKRVSALAISPDNLFVSFADKFGVVWVVSTEVDDERKDEASPIFAHYCSIITSLEFSPDGRFIVSADRDFKIRVTVFPKRPLSGAHEIQSFCLGHTEWVFVIITIFISTFWHFVICIEKVTGRFSFEFASHSFFAVRFVTCLSFVCTQEYPQGFLLSGSGDSTVRLWDITSGFLLDTCEVGMEAGLLESDDKEETLCPAITDICASPDGSLIAVAIQRQLFMTNPISFFALCSLHGVVLLSCNLSGRTLSITKVVSMGGTFIPTSLAMSSSAEHLWIVTGASNLPALDSPSFARVSVISGLKKHGSDSSDDKPVVLDDNEIPGGSKLLEKLQGSVSISKGEEALAAAAEAVKIAMRNLLIKRQYSVEKRELRKKSRNDRKLKQ